MTTWLIKNPLTLPVRVACKGENDFVAKFPSLSCVGKGRTMDEAILNLARDMQAVLSKAMEVAHV